MNGDQTKIKIDVDAWKIKVRERRNNRMRLQINLSKDEAIAFKNFASVCKPEEVSDEDFLKTVFLTGIDGQIKLASTEEIETQTSGAGSVKDTVLHDDEIRKHTKKK